MALPHPLPRSRAHLGSLASTTDALGTPLTSEQARHLHARLTFGGSSAQIQAATGRLAEDVVSDLLDEALFTGEDMPIWIDVLFPPRTATDDERQQFSTNNAEWRRQVRDDLIREMAVSGLRGRLFLFWHNHFVASLQTYSYAALAYRYARTIRQNAQGNFKQFVHDITVDGAMLIYLDGRNNRSTAPNENYARELMELFTMGPIGPDGSANYTENDIQELARAMTGYILDARASWEGQFIPGRHDSGEKTVFGVTGNWDAAGAVEHLFAERSSQIAYFVARKAYREFIHQTVDEAYVTALAEQFEQSGFSIRVLFETLFASERFYDPHISGGIVKSPIELLLGHYVESGQVPNDTQVRQVWTYARQADQYLLSPPNVAGWPGHRDWLDTNTLGTRWNYSSVIVRRRMSEEQILSFANEMADPASQEHAFELPLALANHTFHIPMDWVEVPAVDGDFEGDLDAFPIPAWVQDGPERDRNLIKLFLGTMPWYEWDPQSDGAPARIANFMDRLIQFPEYQLI